MKQKSIHRPQHKVVCAALRDARIAAELTQTQLAEVFGATQAWVSSVEVGITRLDTVQVWEWCRACGVTLVGFATAVQAELEKLPATKRKRHAAQSRSARTAV